MDDVYAASIDAWNESIKKKEYKTKSELHSDIRNRVDKMLCGKRYATDIKDYFISEIVNAVDTSNFDNVIKYVNRKLFAENIF